MLTKVQILESLRTWINQRPGLEFGNYGDWKNYRAELRHITRDRADALQLMQAVSWRESITAQNLIDAFPQAYSGRLAISEGPIISHRIDGQDVDYPPAVKLDYCTGQYWPTEYRAAACAVLAKVLWDRAAADMPEPDGKKITHTHGPFTNEFDSHDGLTAGDWLQRHFRREFGRGIASRWFN